MKVRFHTFEQIHNKRGVGSTKIRVHNLLKYWPEAALYKYGENPDVLIFQKVYMTQDYRMPKFFKNLKILDICDPDWLDGALIKETVDHMDAVTAPTKVMVDFIKQLTDKPVKLIKDRFDLEDFPTPKRHDSQLRKAVWFGYAHNAEALKFAVPSLENRNISLTVISNEDPQAWAWAIKDKDKFHESYAFHKYNENAYSKIQDADVCIFPPGIRPVDRFKSENKTTICKLLGIPVAKTAEEIDSFKTPEARNKWVKDNYEKTKQEYNVTRSVDEYKELINELS